MAANYLPLKKMEELEENISLLDSNIKELISNGFPKVDQDEYVELLLKFSSHDLSDKEATNIFSSIMITYSRIFDTLGVFEVSKDNPTQLITEMFDYVLEPYLLNIWRKNKQVYKPDNDFCIALLRTENLVITKDMFIHLPCKNFYIDLNDCTLFNPIKGIFVNVFTFEDTECIYINFFLLGEDGTLWSSYDFFNFRDTEEIKISQKLMKSVNNSSKANYEKTDVKYESFNDLLCVEVTSEQDQYISGNLNRFETSFFVYQLLTYMVSHEPQIEESKTTKSTYRPPKAENAIKNKFSEIQIHDVGIKFGKSFRQQKKQYKCNTILTKHLESKRKSPIPHFRSAHWQGYWVGRGRTKHIIKWIEPVFVGGEESNDVVIHKI